MASTILADNGVSSGAAGLKSSADSTGTLALQTTTASGTATTAVLIDNAQNVGVGVTPSAWSATRKAVQFGVGGSFNGSTSTYNFADYGANFYNNGTNELYLGADYATKYRQISGQHQWYNAASGSAGGTITFTQAMTLDASGNLSNTGTLTSGTYTKATSYLWAAGTGAAGGVYLGVGSANGCISQASQGTGTVTTYIGNQTITTISDVRLKENIVDTTRNATEILGQLRVVDHTWNDPSDQCENNRNSRGVWMGLIAQEAQPVIPWLVNKPTSDVDEEGNPQYWNMDYGYAVPLLIKAIQEQQAQISSQAAVITSLTERITALEGK